MKIDSTFIDRIISDLEEHYGNDAEIVGREYIKTNGVRKFGITINRKDASGIAPVVYIDELYSSFVECELTIPEVVDEIITMSESNMLDEGIENSIMNLLKFRNVEDKIYPVLINTNLNQELLQNLVAIPYLDLSIIFVIEVGHLRDRATVKITKEMLNQYGKSADELYEIALKNLQEEEYEYQSIAQAIGGMIGQDEEAKLEALESDMGMYVLSNKSRLYASAKVLDEDYIERISGGKRLYFIPSSIHEWIVLKADPTMNPDEISNMVREVNSTAVAPNEVLSDHVYSFTPGVGLECA